MPEILSSNYKRVILWLLGLLVLSIPLCANAGGDKPYLLSGAGFSKVLSSKQVFYRQGAFYNAGGFGIKLKNVQGNQLLLEITTDHELNLWRGRPNDLASAHGGSMELLITSIADHRGREIYAPDLEKSWEKRITIYQKEAGVFRGTRRAFLKRKASQKEIGVIRGVVKLNVPVNFKAMTLEANQSDVSRKVTRHPLINKASYKSNRLTLKHPRAIPGATIVLTGLDAKGGIVPVIATGTAGSQPDNHWFQFKQGRPVTKMLFWIASDKAKRKLRFQIKP